MKKPQKDLISITKALKALAEKVEKLADAFEKETVQAKPVKKTAVKKKAVAKVAKKKAAPKKKAAAKRAAKKAASEEAASMAVEPTEASTKASEQPDDTGSILDNIYGLIGTEGTKIAGIKKKTGLAPRQVSNALFIHSKKGLIDTVSRGAYVKKQP